MNENKISIEARTIHLNGTSYEAGYQLGKIIKEKPLLKERYILKERTVDMMRIEEENELFDRWCPGLCEEIKGFADALQVKLENLYFYDMSYLVPSCSQIALASKVMDDQMPLLVRNYEYAIEQEDFSLVKTALCGKYKHMGTSMLEFGRDEGINEHGFAVTMTSCGLPVVKLPHMKEPKVKGVQYWIVIRALLENCKDVNEALNYIKDMPIAFNMNMLLLDKDENMALVQTMDGKIAVKRNNGKDQESILYTTNHAVLPDFKHLESRAFRHSIGRYQFIEKQLKDKHNITRAQLKSMLLEKYPEGLCFHNYQESFGTTKSILLSPLEGTLEICWGGHFENQWRRYAFDQIEADEEFNIELNIEQTQADIFDWQSF
ncbi:MAG: C45 family autoproteolytic acyltransferase/hydrolase [Beduini sp.]|uniref:C45 family autoproteolytic acyltransferase/hydolase n=1 Tax=Beduini sp. TaxID=1922300 RepID=UPI0011C71E23